jgi:RNA polymerase sigma-70 factor (ECF subfamily)
MNNKITLEELLLKKMKVIYKYLIKMGCERADAEDIVQDTIFKAIIYIETIDPGKIGTWLFKVALNNYYDLCRRNKKFVLNSPEIENIINNLETFSFIPESHALDKERREKVSEALNDLKPVYKNLLVLKYVVGLSYREIADVLDIKEQTIKTYIYRAKQKFKSKWRSIYE